MTQQISKFRLSWDKDNIVNNILSENSNMTQKWVGTNC